PIMKRKKPTQGSASMPGRGVERSENPPINQAISKKALQQALQSIQNWLSCQGGGKTWQLSSNLPFLRLRVRTQRTLRKMYRSRRARMACGRTPASEPEEEGECNWLAVQ